MSKQLRYVEVGDKINWLGRTWTVTAVSENCYDDTKMDVSIRDERDHGQRLMWSKTTRVEIVK